MEGETHKFLLIGEQAPSFEAQTTRGKVKFPDDYRGKWIVLFSHPADFTPVCTTEFVAFQKRFEQFEELNAQLIGLSIDQVFAHIKWVKWIKENLETEIKFPIIADDRGKIAEMFGMIHPAKATNTVRAVFIIDPQSIVRLIIYYPQEVGRNFDEILRVLKALQVVDENKVATPANWPNNELIGDEVIIPPPKDVETAEKRKEEYECYDWWFCHKKL
nr:peroxiredoxin [Candidatus Njordarchaeum guaymaensis]